MQLNICNIQDLNQAKLNVSEALEKCEKDLYEEISLQAGAIFNAMTGLKELQKQLYDTRRRVMEASQELKDSNGELSTFKEELRNKQRDCELFLKSKLLLEDVKKFLSNHRTVQVLMDNLDFLDALKMLQSQAAIFSTHLSDLGILKPIYEESQEILVALTKMIKSNDDDPSSTVGLH